MFVDPIISMRPNQNVSMASHGNDQNVFAEFYHGEPVYQEAESAREGRAIYKDVIFIRITFPGDRTKVYNQPAKLVSPDGGVTPSDIDRFPRQWEAFQKEDKTIVDGTPLESYPPMKKSRVMELKRQDVYTVEQLSALTDMQCSNLGMGTMRERDTAKAWLDSSKDLSVITKLTAAVEQLKIDNDALRNQIADISNKSEEPEEKAAKRGRPPKEKEGE